MKSIWWENKTVIELKVELRWRNLHSSGSKSELVTRLTEDDKKLTTDFHIIGVDEPPTICVNIAHVINESEPVYSIMCVKPGDYVRDLLNRLDDMYSSQDTLTTGLWRDVVSDCYRMSDELYLGGRWRIISGDNTFNYYGILDGQTLLYLEKIR